MQNRIKAHYRDKLQLLYFLEYRYSLFRTNQQHLTPPTSDQIIMIVNFMDCDSLKIPGIYERAVQQKRTEENVPIEL